MKNNIKIQSIDYYIYLKTKFHLSNIIRPLSGTNTAIIECPLQILYCQRAFLLPPRWLLTGSHPPVLQSVIGNVRDILLGHYCHKPDHSGVGWIKPHRVKAIEYYGIRNCWRIVLEMHHQTAHRFLVSNPKIRHVLIPNLFQIPSFLFKSP